MTFPGIEASVTLERSTVFPGTQMKFPRTFHGLSAKRLSVNGEVPRLSNIPLATQEKLIPKHLSVPPTFRDFLLSAHKRKCISKYDRRPQNYLHGTDARLNLAI